MGDDTIRADQLVTRNELKHIKEGMKEIRETVAKLGHEFVAVTTDFKVEIAVIKTKAVMMGGASGAGTVGALLAILKAAGVI